MMRYLFRLVILLTFRTKFKSKVIHTRTQSYTVLRWIGMKLKNPMAVKNKALAIMHVRRELSFFYLLTPCTDASVIF